MEPFFCAVISNLSTAVAVRRQLCQDQPVGQAVSIDLLTEFTVVLPQKYRSRVEGISACGGNSFVLLLQDFTTANARPRGERWNNLEPIWRLFRYDKPDPIAVEVCTFTQSVNDILHPVFVAEDNGRLYMLFHDQILEVNLEDRSVNTICRLRLPGKDPTVKGFAVQNEVACLTVEDSDVEQLGIHWVPFENKPTLGAHFPGSRGSQLSFHDDCLYALDMLDLYCFRNGELVTQVDLSGRFPGWHQSPRELLAVGGSGELYVACGDNLVILSPQQLEVRASYKLPAVVETMAYVSSTNHLLLRSRDGTHSRLVIREVRC